MGFFNEYAGARETERTLNDQALQRQRQVVTDTGNAQARMERLKQVEIQRKFPTAEELPDAEAIRFGAAPTAAAAAPVSGGSTQPGTMGGYVPRPSAPAPVPSSSNAIEVSEANRRLQAMRRSAAAPAQPPQTVASGGPPADLKRLQAMQRAAGSTWGAGPMEAQLNPPQQTSTVGPPIPQPNVRPTTGQITGEAARLKQLQAAGAPKPVAPTPAAGPVPAGTSVAARNNNPGNLKFAGQAGARPGPMLPDGTQFAVFDTPDAGMAANVNQLRIYGTRGINTVEKIINTWSPAGAHGNNAQSTANYIAHVARTLGVPPNQPLDMANPQVLQAIAQAQAPFESGTGHGGGGQAPGAPAPQGQGYGAAPAPTTPVARVIASGGFTAEQLAGMANQQMQQAKFKMQRIQELAQAVSDPKQLGLMQDDYAKLQEEVREAHFATLYATGKLTPEQYAQVSEQERARSNAAQAERQKQVSKAEGEIAVEDARGVNARQLEQQKQIGEAVAEAHKVFGTTAGLKITSPDDGKTLFITQGNRLMRYKPGVMTPAGLSDPEVEEIAMPPRG